MQRIAIEGPSPKTWRWRVTVEAHKPAETPVPELVALARGTHSAFWLVWSSVALAIAGTTAAFWAWFGGGIALGAGGMLAGIVGVFATLGAHRGWF